MAAKAIVVAAFLLPVSLAACLNPSCAPGGNFDLRYWSLQLPTGDDGKAGIIKSTELQGCQGYQDANFFTDDSTSQLVMLAPGNPQLTQCATTSGSTHCRTELREVDKDSGANAAWDPIKTNTLSVTMTVVSADDGTHGTAIGQIFASDAGKPLVEMYYSRDGEIVVGVKPDANGNQIITQVGQVPVGTQFDYVLSYSADRLSVSINGVETELSTYSWESPRCYFKTGNYNQGKSEEGSEVHIAAIKVSHTD